MSSRKPIDCTRDSPMVANWRKVREAAAAPDATLATMRATIVERTEQRDALVAALHGVMAALDPNSLHQPDAQHAWALARLALLGVAA